MMSVKLNYFQLTEAIGAFFGSISENSNKAQVFQDSSKLRNIARCAHAEQLTLLPYVLGLRTATTSLIDHEGSKQDYAVYKVPTAQVGLYCYILFSEQSTSNTVHVLFRGTYNVANAWYTGENHGSGFTTDRDTIMNSIKTVIAEKQRYTKDLTLSIAGDGQAGADVQYCVIEILANILAHKEQSHFANLSALEIIHNNSVGILDQKVQVANQHVRDVNKICPRLRVQQYITQSKGEPLTSVGNSVIFADIDPSIVSTMFYSLNELSTVSKVLSKLSKQTSRSLEAAAGLAQVYLYDNAVPLERIKIAAILTNIGSKHGKSFTAVLHTRVVESADEETNAPQISQPTNSVSAS